MLIKTIYISTNKDCYRNIISYIHPNKKLIAKWFREHKKKTYCHNKDWWKKYKYTYICDIYKFGYIYNYIHTERENERIITFNTHGNTIKNTFFSYLYAMKLI